MKALELIATALLAVFLLGLGMVTAPYWGLVILLAACGITEDGKPKRGASGRLYPCGSMAWDGGELRQVSAKR